MSDEFIEKLNKIKLPINKKEYKKEKRGEVDYKHPESFKIAAPSKELAREMKELESSSERGRPLDALKSAEEIAGFGYGSNRRVKTLLVQSYENLITNPDLYYNYSHGNVREPPQSIKKKISSFLKEHPSKKVGKLERTTGIVAVVGILGGMFFLSSNLTGNVVGTTSQNSANWIGAVLFVLGIACGFVYAKKRKLKIISLG